MGAGSSVTGASSTIMEKDAPQTPSPNSKKEDRYRVKSNSRSSVRFTSSTKRLREVTQSIHMTMNLKRKFGARATAARILQTLRPSMNFFSVVSSHSTDLHTYIQTIIAEMQRRVNAHRCSIFFVDDIRQEVWCVGGIGIEGFSMSMTKGIVGLVATDGKLLNLEDVHNHPAFDPTWESSTEYRVTSMLAIPIKHVGDATRVMGVLQVMNKKSAPNFTSHDCQEAKHCVLQISDSFYRQRWKALAQRSEGDDAATAMQDMHSRFRSRDRRSSTACLVDGDDNLKEFEVWTILRLSSAQEPSVPESIRELDFDTLSYAPQQLEAFVPAVFLDMGFFERFSMEGEKLRQFVSAMRSSYRDNPFHNWFHGFDVFQFCFAQLCSITVKDYIEPLDALALLIGALGHDADHPGRTNAFLIEIEHSTAIRYNDNSVLENHHAYVTCELLRKPQTAILENLSRPEYKAVRKAIISAILATDMEHHSEMCQMITSRDAIRPFRRDTPKDRQTLLGLLIHTSDLSAQVRPWKNAWKWCERISKEFSAQAAAEKQRGLEPAAFMCGLDDERHRSKLQVGFIDYVLLPLWEPHTTIFIELRCCYANLVENRKHYGRVAETGSAMTEDDKAAAGGSDSHEEDLEPQRSHSTGGEKVAKKPKIKRASTLGSGIPTPQAPLMDDGNT
eukprot:g3674.t1